MEPEQPMGDPERNHAGAWSAFAQSGQRLPLFSILTGSALMPKARRYLTVLASISLGMLLVAALVNILIDPYAMHGVVDIDRVNRVKEESGSHARLYTAAMITRHAPTVLALGTSRSARGISMDHPGWKGVQSERYNASLLGANMYEIERYFEHAHRTRRLTQVVVGLDLFAFNVYKPNQSDFNDALVLDHQRNAAVRHRLELLKTSLSLDTLYSSYLTLRCNRRE